MTGPVHTAVYKGRFVLIALFTTAIGLCGWQASVIPLPSSSQVKLLPDAHVAQKFREWHNDLRSSGNDNSWTSVVWGLEPGDTGDVFDPLKLTKLLADRSFDPSSEVAQEWLLAFCNTTRAAGFTMAGYGCVLRDIQEWLARRVADDEYDPCGGALALPIVPARFHACVAAWSENECGVGETGWCDGVAMYRGRLVVLVFSFQVGIRWDSSYEKLRSMVGQWEGWMGEQNGAAPAGVSRGYFTSGEFHWWDTNRSMLEGAYLSIMTALIVVSAAVLTSTLNLLTTVYAIVSVCAVLLLVIGTVVGMGWELGFLEGICFAILIGLSCDFVLHMAHAYQASAELTRQDKSRDALTRMGPPIFAAALTTAATGAVMYGCTILFFLRFGTILLLSMVYAILTAVFFFLALTNAGGPQKHFGSLAPLFSLFRRELSAGRRNGPGAAFTPKEGTAEV
jgi:5-methyltetrahydrofolate--homocysteine methyltransferase